VGCKLDLVSDNDSREVPKDVAESWAKEVGMISFVELSVTPSDTCRMQVLIFVIRLNKLHRGNCVAMCFTS
jgi:hypothetical protein